MSSFLVVYSGKIILNPVSSSWSIEISPLNLFLLKKLYLCRINKYHYLQKAELIFLRGCASVRVNGVAETGQRHFFEQNFLFRRSWRKTFWLTLPQRCRWHSEVSSTHGASWLMLDGAQDARGACKGGCFHQHCWSWNFTIFLGHLSLSLNCLFLPRGFRPSRPLECCRDIQLKDLPTSGLSP